MLGSVQGGVPEGCWRRRVRAQKLVGPEECGPQGGGSVCVGEVRWGGEERRGEGESKGGGPKMSRFLPSVLLVDVLVGV